MRKLAVLSSGLPRDSRSMRNITGEKLTTDQMLLAAICDRLSVIAWQNTKDGRKGRNYPKSILSELMKEPEEKPMAFKDGAAFMAAREKLLGGG